MVKDLAPGSESSNSNHLVNIGGILYFTACDPIYGRELWRSDGTEAGTQVFDLVPGSESSFPANLTPIQGTLLFSALDPATQTLSL